MLLGASLHERTSALLECVYVNGKTCLLSLRNSDVRSKVITKIVCAEEGEPGDEAN